MTLGDIVKKYREDNNISMDNFSKRAGLSKGYISMLEKNKNPNSGKPIRPSLLTIKSIAMAMNIDVNDLIDSLDNQEVILSKEKDAIDTFSYKNILPITIKKVPLLGIISCGEPIFCNEEHESYMVVGTDIEADFCLRAKGDSMINARIMDGDIVFIRQQPFVDNGDIAAVLIDNEVTLKRVYYYKDDNMMSLNPENPLYKPFIYTGEELNHIKILGKAIAFQSDIK